MPNVKRELSFEEKVARVKDYRPIDDTFFEVLATEPGVCEEILRTVLEDPDLTVDPESIIVQSSKRNLYGRSVRLDALCTLGDGTKCNIEVQRSDDDDHPRRARFNASSITVRESNPGERFEDVVNLYIVFISEFDFLGEGRTIYHVESVILESGAVIDDGLHEVFVNTVINDDTKIADLMSCFTKKEVNDPRFPRMSEAVKRLKTTEGGVSAVCSLTQQYMDAARQEGIEEGRTEGQATLAEAIHDLHDGASREEMLKKYDERTVDLAFSCR